jgi:hypothetical protein
MRPSQRPYAWFGVLIDGANSVYQAMIDMEKLQNTEVNTWEIGGDTYAPVTTLTWRAEDGVSRNLHYALVAPDDAGSLVPGSEAVTEANAWVDITERSGVVVRRQVKYAVDRVGDLVEEQVNAYLARQPIIFWQGYGAVRQIERAKLESSGQKKKSPDADPGPIGLEKWLGE